MKTSNDLVVSTADRSKATAEASGAITGSLAGFARNGAPLIDIEGARFQARSCASLHADDVGAEVVAIFEAARPDTPIVLGVIRPLRDVDAVVDGRRVSVTARESITLKCGDASITLNRDGKIVIRGAHVVSHASGVNRIRGGSVELN
jgi:hypothetical protein